MGNYFNSEEETEEEIFNRELEEERINTSNQLRTNSDRYYTAINNSNVPNKDNFIFYMYTEQLENKTLNQLLAIITRIKANKTMDNEKAIKLLVFIGLLIKSKFNKNINEESLFNINKEVFFDK